MKDLQPYASDFDKWIYSLLEMLRTKYFDVEVLRGRDVKEKKEYHSFYYKVHQNADFDIERIEKPTLDEHFQNKTTPQQIKDLLK